MLMLLYDSCTLEAIPTTVMTSISGSCPECRPANKPGKFYWAWFLLQVLFMMSTPA